MPINTTKKALRTKGIIILIIITLIGLFSGCENPLITKDLSQGLNNNTANNGDFVDANGDVFVDGLNTSYMKANGLTEADMMALIKEQVISEAEVTEGTKGYENTDLFDIMGNFDDYFTFYINDYRNESNTTTSAELRLGLNTDLLTTPLAEYSNVVKDTRWNYQRIYSFSIQKLENQFIYLKGRLHVKSWTAGPFNSRIKLADKTADIYIKLEFLFDTSTNGVGYKYEITKVDIDRKWTDIFFGALAFIYPPPIGISVIVLNETHRFIVKRKILNDGKDMFFVELGNYVDPEYFVIKPITSSSSWLYFNFAATSKGINLIRVLKEMLFSQTKVIYREYLYKRIYAEADALLNGVTNKGVDYRNTNYGNYPKIVTSAWTYQGNQGLQRSLIKFPTNQIPSNVSSARLYLYGVGEHDPLTKSNETYVQRVTSAWSESTVTWNNQPSTTTIGQKIIGSLTNSTPDASVDVTPWVTRWNSPIKILKLENYGLLLKLKTESYYAKMTFGSSDNPTSSKRPYLLVRYYTSRTSN